MRKEKVISASIQALPNFNFEESINKLKNAGIQGLHIDIMDATKTDGFGLNPEILSNVDRKNLLIDFHIMSENPLNLVKLIKKYSNCIAHTHLKMINNYKDFISAVKKTGLIPGITLDLDDDLSKISSFIKELQFVNFMSVSKIGCVGQKFNTNVFDKIKSFIKIYGDDFIICVDGSIRIEHLEHLSLIANVFVVGSILYNYNDWKTGLDILNKEINK